MGEKRNKLYAIELTKSEEDILNKLRQELDLPSEQVVGKALRVFQKCREFIEN